MISNRTLDFILPMIAEDRTIKFYNNKYFHGAFINDVDKTTMYDCLILVYKNPNDFNFIFYDNLITKHPSYIGCYYTGKDRLVYIFDIPKEFKEDYINIINGEYSEISNNLKEKIKAFWPTKTIEIEEYVKKNLSIENELFDVIES